MEKNENVKFKVKIYEKIVITMEDGNIFFHKFSIY